MTKLAGARMLVVSLAARLLTRGLMVITVPPVHSRNPARARGR